MILVKAWLRQLLEPAQTSRTDSFVWSDKRPKGKQVASGLRIVGGLLTGFLVLMVVLVGLSKLSEDQPSGGSSFFAWWVALALAAILMLWTANRWAPFVAAFFFGPAVVKILAVLVFEQDTYYSSHSISRKALAELLVYSLAVVALTARFVGKRPASVTVFDRLALTFFVFTSLSEVVVPNPFLQWPLFAGTGGLLASWMAERFTRVKRTRRHHAHDPEIPIAPLGR